jgi:hypothetical protein
MEFELQQIIRNSFNSYVLINPLSIVCVCLVLVICTRVPARRTRCITARLRLTGFHPRFSSGLFA